LVPVDFQREFRVSFPIGVHVAAAALVFRPTARDGACEKWKSIKQWVLIGIRIVSQTYKKEIEQKNDPSLSFESGIGTTRGYDHNRHVSSNNKSSRTDLALWHFRQLHRLVTEHLQHVTSLQVHPHQRRHLKIKHRNKGWKQKVKKHFHQFSLFP
jgi:hypothetical protein